MEVQTSVASGTAEERLEKIEQYVELLPANVESHEHLRPMGKKLEGDFKKAKKQHAELEWGDCEI